MARFVPRARSDAPQSSGLRAIAHLFGEFERLRAERDMAEDRLTGFTQAIQQLINVLPEGERVECQKRFDQIRLGEISSKSGEVLGNVIRLLNKDPARRWKIQEIQDNLKREGSQQDTKSIYNAVSYLAKIGRLQRISRGIYSLTDFGVSIEFEGPDYGINRITEHDY